PRPPLFPYTTLFRSGLRSAELRAHRQLVRAAADARARNPDDKTVHDTRHAVLFKPRSSRPLLTKLDQTALPSVDPKGINGLPWRSEEHTSELQSLRH